MGAGEDILKVLARIEGKLDRLLASGANGGPSIATDYDLDGQYGDENIRRDPPRWKGDKSYAGMKMSEASAEYLDVLGEFYDWKADRDAEEAEKLGTGGQEDEAAKKLKYSGYGRKSAARARGWALRKRNGWKPAPAPEAGDVSWG